MRPHEAVKQRHLDQLDEARELHAIQAESVAQLLTWKDMIVGTELLPSSALTVLSVLCSRLYLSTSKMSPVVKALQLERKAKTQRRIASTACVDPSVEGGSSEDDHADAIRNSLMQQGHNEMQTAVRMLLWTRLGAKLKQRLVMQAQVRQRAEMARQLERANASAEEALTKMKILTEGSLPGANNQGAFSIKAAEDVLRQKAAASRRKLHGKHASRELMGSPGSPGAEAVHPFAPAGTRSQRRTQSQISSLAAEEPASPGDGAPLPLDMPPPIAEQRSANSIGDSCSAESSDMDEEAAEATEVEAEVAMGEEKTRGAGAAVVTLRLGTPPGPLQPLPRASRPASGGRAGVDSPSNKVTLPPLPAEEPPLSQRPLSGMSERTMEQEFSRRNIPSGASGLSCEPDGWAQGTIPIVHDWHTDVLLDDRQPLLDQQPGSEEAPEGNISTSAASMPSAPAPADKPPKENIWESPDAAKRAALRVLGNATAAPRPEANEPAPGAPAGKAVPWWAQGGAQPPPSLQQKVLQNAMAKTLTKSNLNQLATPKSTRSLGSKEPSSTGVPGSGSKKPQRLAGDTEEPPAKPLPSLPSQHAAVSKPPSGGSVAGSASSKNGLRKKISGNGARDDFPLEGWASTHSALPGSHAQQQQRGRI